MRLKEAVPALVCCLQEDRSPLVRGHAAWALGEIGGSAAETALREASEKEADGGVLSEIEHAVETSLRRQEGVSEAGS
jgi:epoxyqueuosine reductase